jgi:hypothetical protein
MSRIRFELDRRSFGMVRFTPVQQAGAKGLRLEKLMPQALSTALAVKLKVSREGLFGPRVHWFKFRGEKITVRKQADGTATIDLSAVDDETREVLIEALRHSIEFDAFY